MNTHVNTHVAAGATQPFSRKNLTFSWWFGQSLSPPSRGSITSSTASPEPTMGSPCGGGNPHTRQPCMTSLSACGWAWMSASPGPGGSGPRQAKARGWSPRSREEGLLCPCLFPPGPPRLFPQVRSRISTAQQPCLPLCYPPDKLFFASREGAEDEQCGFGGHRVQGSRDPSLPRGLPASQDPGWISSLHQY